jgi:hypothetical protein
MTTGAPAARRVEAARLYAALPLERDTAASLGVDPLGAS